MDRNNEAGLIGSIMRDASRYEFVRELLTPADFGWHAYGWCWEAFSRLHAQGLAIDTITTGDELERMGKLSDFCMDDGKMLTGRAALGKLRAEGNPDSVESYAANVLDHSAKRQLLEDFRTGAAWAMNGRRATDIVSDMMEKLNRVRTFDGKSARHTQKLGDAVSAA